MKTTTLVAIVIAILNGIWACKMHKQKNYRAAMLSCVALGSCLPLIFNDPAGA